IETAEAKDGPRPGQEEHDPGRQADAAQHQHQHDEAAAAERAVRGEHRRKDRGFSGTVVVGRHGAHYTGTMARKTPRTAARRIARKAPRRTAQSLRTARRGKAEVKGPAKRLAADRKAA